MKKGFALIYTLLFITLLLTAASATWLTGMADLRLSQSSNYSVQASELAQSAIDAGYAKYSADIGSAALLDITYPPNACATTSKVIRVNPNTNPATTSTTNLQPAPALTETVTGRYDYRICTNPTTHKTTIEGIGYYKGNKASLKAEVTHGSGEESCNTAIPPVCTLNHDNDYLTIYQVGSSQ